MKVAAVSIARVLRLPRYAVLAAFVAVVFMYIVNVLINIQFYGPLISPRLSLAGHLNVVGIILRQLVGDLATVNGMLLAVVSVLQGVSIAALVYSMRRNARNQPAAAVGQQAGASGLAAVAAAIGLGCVPCGTSLVLPLVAMFFSGASAVTAATYATMVVLVVAVVLTVYSLYRAGYIAYMHSEAEKHDKAEEESK